jgi:hypothetical protein
VGKEEEKGDGIGIHFLLFFPIMKIEKPLLFLFS